MTLANIARVLAVALAVAAVAGSASNSSYQQPPQSQMTQQQYGQSGGNPPPAQEMEGSRALGVWRSTFGAVKIEADDSRGGIEAGSVQGVWVYQRHGQEVIGYFSGTLRGNVLQFKWQEDNNPPLSGSGYLVFDRTGRQYSGRWWSEARDRVGDWNGWRNGSNEGSIDRDDRTNENPPEERRTDDPYGPTPPTRDARPPRQPRDPQPSPSNGGGYGPQPPPPTYY